MVASDNIRTHLGDVVRREDVNFMRVAFCKQGNERLCFSWLAK